jgi:hypothetical protein
MGEGTGRAERAVGGVVGKIRGHKRLSLKKQRGTTGY